MKKTVLYQIVPETRSLLMCYIIKTEQNKLIVIDGGMDDVNGGASKGYLFRKLQEISGKEKPEIEAWFFTHDHSDHINEFTRMVQNHSGEFTVNNFYFNFPSRSFIMANEGGCLADHDAFVAAYNKYKGSDDAYDSYKGVKTGDSIKIDNLIFDILLTPDESITFNAINNTSIVFRMTAGGQTVLFLGDLGVESGNRLIAAYGNNGLKSDIVQMAHHGQNGVSKEVYEKINPKVCLWPTPIWVWENKEGRYQTTEVRKWMFDDLKVKYHYVTGLKGTQMIELPYEGLDADIMSNT